MHDRPTADELLGAVEQLMDEQLVPALDGAARYNARVAANVIRIVRREIASEERQLHQEWHGLNVIFGPQEPPRSLEVLRAAIVTRNQQFAERIQSGAADGDRRVIAHVRDVVRAKLEVANPAWLEA